MHPHPHATPCPGDLRRGGRQQEHHVHVPHKRACCVIRGSTALQVASSQQFHFFAVTLQLLQSTQLPPQPTRRWQQHTQHKKAVACAWCAVVVEGCGATKNVVSLQRATFSPICLVIWKPIPEPPPVTSATFPLRQSVRNGDCSAEELIVQGSSRQSATPSKATFFSPVETRVPSGFLPEPPIWGL